MYSSNHSKNFKSEMRFQNLTSNSHLCNKFFLLERNKYNFHPETFYIHNILNKQHAIPDLVLPSKYIDRGSGPHNQRINGISYLKSKQKRFYIIRIIQYPNISQI